MFQSFFTQSQQIVDGWANVLRSELGRAAASAEDLEQLRSKGVARATEAAGDMAKLAKDALEQMSSLPAEWRNLWVRVASQSIDAVTPAP
jgi:hypothetical protein